MLHLFRIPALAVLCLCALLLGATARGAEDVLPPEPTDGEWMEDTFADGGLWFASSENLEFDEVAPVLGEYPRGRRWVRVVDGRPAWVMYYVPGEILGFEVDTHHFGARAVEFRFAAGTDWQSLTAVEADFEEIAAFEAKWMRLYRTVDRLPPDTRFLKIEFPQDADFESARLTEVWIRCRFDEAVGPKSAQELPATEGTAAGPPAMTGDGPVIEPYIVTAFHYDAPPLAFPDSAPVTADTSPPEVAVKVPPRVTIYELLPDVVPSQDVPVPGSTVEGPSVFSRIVSFLHISSAK